MNINFYLYLAIIPLLAIFIVFLVRFFGAKKTAQSITSIQSIDCGNMSVFFDRNSNVVGIPYIKDKYGVGRATKGVQFLSIPYRQVALGQLVRDVLNCCRNAEPLSHDQLMPTLGFLDWKDFSRGRRNISIHYRVGVGLVLNTTRRRHDGGYAFNHMGYEKIISKDASNAEIGQMLLSLLSRCRS